MRQAPKTQGTGTASPNTSKKKRGILAMAVAALALVFAAGSAEAGGWKNKHHGKHYGKHYGKHHGHHRKHHGKRYRKYKKKSTVIIFGSNGYTAFTYPQSSYFGHHRRHYVITDRPVCRLISKVGYWYGKKAVIGGTACPNAYGQLNVLNGTHYLIRYIY